MSKKTEYTAEHIEGVKDARDFMRRWNRGELIKGAAPMTADDMRKECDTEKRCLAMKPGKPVADMHRGAIEFWTFQIKKAESK